ncbi:sensor histidine kinase [Actinoplanes sp. RD1]|uniref:sensor histidine kinase n=1 Tax=Actinoplanes sp. RD1 TaxID=3064538 RepID=UPI0027419E15|nr:histidine kinase [Actinoplanes sp. RD1]
MDWLSRMFATRGALVRMVLLDLSGVGYLTVIARDTPAQWALAVPAFAAALLLHRRPAANLAVQAGLFAAAVTLLDDSTINAVGAAWALLEAAARSARPVRWWGAGALAVVYLAGQLRSPDHPLQGRLYTLVPLVGLPLLVGALVRANAELGRQATERAAAEQRRREAEAREARIAERGAVARELHDVVAHHVASMVLRIGVARHVLPGLTPQVQEVFDDVHATGTTALTDLRRLVELLRGTGGPGDDAALTVIEPAALSAALDGAVETARRAGLVVDADIAPEIAQLDAVRSLALLRLTQEALTNVAKHAGLAAKVRLTVRVADGTVGWEVADDGGSPTGAGPVVRGGGHGLTGMRERVSMLGGELEAGPRGAGWRVATVLPRVAA